MPVKPGEPFEMIPTDLARTITRRNAVSLATAADILTYGLRADESSIEDIRRVDSLHSRVSEAFEALATCQDDHATELATSVITELTAPPGKSAGPKDAAPANGIEIEALKRWREGYPIVAMRTLAGAGYTAEQRAAFLRETAIVAPHLIPAFAADSYIALIKD